MLRRLGPVLLRVLLVGPRMILPPAYELYAAFVIPRSPTVRAFLRHLASLPAVRPHYVYLNVGRGLALDPSSATLVAAAGREIRHQPIGAIRALVDGPRGVGYRLRLDFADGTHWEARTLVSVEPLLTAADLLRLARARAARGDPPPPPQPVVAGAGVSPDA